MKKPDFTLKHRSRQPRAHAEDFDKEVDALAIEENISRAAAADKLRHAVAAQKSSELEPRLEEPIADSTATETTKHDE